mmetsp:Transcript_11664/g.23229  ORF Transcript_11664/g.23229 Transcript_11664/m.23229 type:complete len:124 (-) Transcript_11664:284-655(-)
MEHVCRRKRVKKIFQEGAARRDRGREEEERAEGSTGRTPHRARTGRAQLQSSSHESDVTLFSMLLPSRQVARAGTPKSVASLCGILFLAPPLHSDGRERTPHAASLSQRHVTLPRLPVLLLAR